MLNILTTYNSHDGTEYFFDVIQKTNCLTDTVYVIVPEQYTYETELNLINRLGHNGIFHVEVFSMRKLIRHLALRSGLKNGELLSELGKKIALKKILIKLNSKLKFYKNAHLSEEFIDIILLNLDALRQDMINARQLYDIANKVVVDNKRLADKLLELSLIYSEYSDILSNTEPDDYQMLEMLINHYISLENQDITIIVDGFSGMSRLEIRLLSALASSSQKDCYVRLLKNRINSSVNMYVDRFEKELISEFTELRMPYKNSYSDFNSYDSADFYASLFSLDFKHAKTDIEIIEALNREDEIKNICMTILDKVQNENLTFSDFAVISSNVDEYKSKILRVFSLYGVPCYFDEKKPISAHYFVDFLVSSFNAIIKNYDKDEIIALVKSALKFIDIETDINLNQLIFDFESHLYKKNINYNDFFCEEKWETYFSKTIDSLNQTKNATAEQVEGLKNKQTSLLNLRNQLLYPLKELAESLNTAQHFEDVIILVELYIKNSGLLEKIDECINETDNDREIKTLNVIKNQITKTIEQVKKLSINSDFTSEEVLEMIKYGIAEFKVGLTPPAEETVILGNLARTMFTSAKYIFFPFANEGVYPKTSSGASLIFTEKEIELMEKNGYDNIKSSNKFYDKEVYDIYEKICKAEKKIYFSYSLKDDTGKELLRSPFVDMMKNNGAKLTKVPSFSLKKIASKGNKRLLFETILRENDINLSLGSKIEFYQNNGFAREFEVMQGAKRCYEYHMSKNQVLDKGKVLKLSVTRLDKQANCPFSYFVDYILKPKTLLADEVNQLETGNLFHGVLESFTQKYILSDYSEDFLQNIETKLLEIYNQKASELEGFSYDNENAFRKFVLPISIKLFANNFAEQLRSSLKKNVDIYPEIPYRYSYNIAGYRVVLNGVIDRLDVFKDIKTKSFDGEESSHDYLRVVDYKSGRAEYNEEKILFGCLSQLPTYLEMALHMNLETGKVDFEKECNRLAFGMFYQNLKNCSVKEDSATEKYQVEKMKQYKLDGRLLDNVEIANVVSPSLAETGEATDMKAKIKKDGSFSAVSQIYNDVAFDEIVRRNKANREKLTESIINMEHDITPVKLKVETACDYCKFGLICRFNKIANFKCFKTVDKKKKDK